jgi:PAS domain S-box-containing protein
MGMMAAEDREAERETALRCVRENVPDVSRQSSNLQIEAQDPSVVGELGQPLPLVRARLLSPMEGAPAAGTSHDVLALNRQLLAILGALPGVAYRYVVRADGSEDLPFINEKAKTVLCIASEELRKNPGLLFEVFCPEDRDRLKAALHKPVARLIPIDAELLIEPRVGGRRWVRLIVRPSVTESGDVAWDGVILDVDDDVRRRLSHETLATAVQNAADAIEITDTDFRIQYINPAFERITGYDRNEAVGKTPGALLRGGHFDQAYYEAIERTILAGKTWRGELIARARTARSVTRRRRYRRSSMAWATSSSISR